MSHRTMTVKEELANTLTHGAGLLLSVIGLILLLNSVFGKEDTREVVSAWVYGLSLIILYAASTCYHGCSCQERKQKFKIWDHCSIYLLIAGSYTPFTLISLDGTTGWFMLGIIWALALFGIALKVLFINRFEVFSLILYLLMGWLAILTLDSLYNALPLQALLLIFAGGLSYTFGVVFFVWKKPTFQHAIWHLFVLMGSFFHYVAVYTYVL